MERALSDTLHLDENLWWILRIQKLKRHYVKNDIHQLLWKEKGNYTKYIETGKCSFANK